MTKIPIKSFGIYLVGREEGRSALAVFKRDYFDTSSTEKFFCDFSDVFILAPSYCDEVFGQLQEKYPDQLIIDKNINKALKVSFETIEDTRGMKFNYQEFKK